MRWIFAFLACLLPLAGADLLRADFETDARARAGDAWILPSGHAALGEVGGKRALQAWGAFAPIRYATRGLLPKEKGFLRFDYSPRLKARQASGTPKVMATFLSVKSPSPPDYAGFSIGANLQENGKVYLWLIVAGKNGGQIYREVSLPDGVWCEIAASWGPRTLTLFLDGKPVGDMARPESIFAEVDLCVGGYGAAIADGAIRGLAVRDASPYPAGTDEIDFEFPGKKGVATLLRHTGMAITAERLALVVAASEPCTMTVRSAVFQVKPGQGYAVNYSGRPHDFLVADTRGVLRIPLPDFQTYNTLVAVPQDIRDLLGGASWKGVVDDRAVATLGWGHEGGAALTGASSLPAGAYSRDAKATRTGAPAFRLEKLRQGGEVRWESSPVILEAGKEYLLSGWYQAERSEFGAVALFGVTLRTADGKSQTIHQTYLNPLIAPLLGARWRYAYLRVKAPANIAEAVAVLGLRGSAGQAISWDGLGLRLAPPTSANIVQELPAADTAPALPLEELRSLWAGREGVRVETAPGPFPVLRVDGKPVPSLVYNAYVVDPKEAELGPMLAAGIRWLYVRIAPHNKEWWIGEDRYDFSDVQPSLEAALQRDPGAVVMLEVPISPRYREWGDLHPEAIWRDHDGEKIAGLKKTIRALQTLDNGKDAFWAHSYAASQYRESAARALEALVAHLKSFSTGKAVAGINFHCGTDNQWFPHVNYVGFDYSTGAQKDFRERLRKRYGGDVARLRAAWANPEVDFETATLAPFAMRNRASVSFLDPERGADRWILDSNRDNDDGATETAKFLGAAVKKAFGRNVFINLYAPDIAQGYSGRGGKAAALEGPGVDGFVSVPEYGLWRQAGRTGTFASAFGSLALHGKIFLSELDYRTHTCWISADAFDYLYYYHGGVQSEAEFAGQARRDLGALLAGGQGAWFLAMNRHLFSTPAYRGVVAELARAARLAAEKPMPADRAQMAVYIDEDTRHATSYPYGPGLNNLSIGVGKLPLFRSGVSWDLYYLSDLDHPARPAYKVHYFAAAPTLPARQIEYVRKNLQKDGNILVFCNAAAAVSDAGRFEENIQALTGMRIRMDRAAVDVYRVRPVPCDDPIAKGLRDNVLTEMKQPLVWVEDPQAIRFGEIPGTGKAGWAIRRFPGWTSVYLALPGSITPELLRNLIREAGLEPLGPVGDVCSGGNGFLSLHALSDGEKALSWKGACDVEDLATGTLAAKNAQSLRFPMLAGETRWFRKKER